MRRVLMLGGVLMLVLVGVLAVARQQTPMPQWIYFQRNYQLHRVTWDGSHMQALPNNVSLVNASPDGNWLLTWVHEQLDTFLSGPNFSELRSLGQSESPMWSPDSRKIAAKVVDDLSIYDLETDRWTSLLDVSTDRDYAVRYSLRWSPDGEWLLFWSVPDELIRLFRIHVHSSGFQSYDGVQNVANVVWSSDGEWIALSMSGPDQIHDIYIMRPDGSAMQNLTNTLDTSEVLINEGGDGWLFYVADSFVYRMRLDGGEVKRLIEFSDFYNMNFYGDWTVYSENNPHRTSNLFRYNHITDTRIQLTSSSLNDTRPYILPPSTLNWHPTALATVAALTLGAAAIPMRRRKRMG